MNFRLFSISSIAVIILFLFTSNLSAFNNLNDTLSYTHIIGEKVQLLKNEKSFFISSSDYGLRKLFDIKDISNPDNGLVKKRMQGTLILYMKDCSDINSSINKTELYESSLIETFEKYQNCIGEEVEVLNVSNLETKLSLGVNILFKNLNYFVLELYAYDPNNPGGSYDPVITNTISPEISFIVRNKWNNSNHNFDFGGNIGYDNFILKMDSEQFNTKRKVEVNNIYLAIIANYAYSLNLNKGLLKIGPGFIGQYSIFEKNNVELTKPVNNYTETETTYSSNNESLLKLNFMYSLNLEYIINSTSENPISIGVSYQSTLYARGQSFNDDFEGYKNVCIGISYFL